MPPEQFGAVLRKLLASGFKLPLYFAIIASNGSIFAESRHVRGAVSTPSEYRTLCKRTSPAAWLRLLNALPRIGANSVTSPDSGIGFSVLARREDGAMMTKKEPELSQNLVDVDLERMTLGAVLVDESAFGRIAGILKADDFVPRRHQVIWRAMQRLSNKGTPIEVVTLFTELREHGDEQEAGGLSYLTQLDDGVPKLVHPEHYAKVLRDKSLQRRISAVSAHISEEAALGVAKPDDLLRRLREAAEDLGTLDVGLEPPLYGLAELQHDLSNTPDWLETGYQSLSHVRIPQGALTVIAGRPGHCKTTIQLNLLLKLSQRDPDRRFYFFSFEEARVWLALKLVIIMAGEVLHEQHNLASYVSCIKHPAKLVLNPAVHEAVTKYDSLVTSGRLSIVDKDYSVEDLTRVIATAGQKYSVGAVFVDYLQKIPPARQEPTRYQEIQHVSARLLRQAVESNIPIILVRNSVEDPTRRRTEKKCGWIISASAATSSRTLRWSSASTTSPLKPQGTKLTGLIKRMLSSR